MPPGQLPPLPDPPPAASANVAWSDSEEIEAAEPEKPEAPEPLALELEELAPGIPPPPPPPAPFKLSVTMATPAGTVHVQLCAWTPAPETVMGLVVPPAHGDCAEAYPPAPSNHSASA